MGLVDAELIIDSKPYETIMRKYGRVHVSGLELEFDAVLSDQEGLSIEWITHNIDEEVKEELEEVIRDNIKW